MQQGANAQNETQLCLAVRDQENKPRCEYIKTVKDMALLGLEKDESRCQIKGRLARHVEYAQDHACGGLVKELLAKNNDTAKAEKLCDMRKLYNYPG